MCEACIDVSAKNRGVHGLRDAFFCEEINEVSAPDLIESRQL
jgi:hypothetical protein